MPDLPEEVEYIWGWFTELHQSRTGNGFGPNPLANVEIAAWARLCHIEIEPWEVRAIRAIDTAYLVASRENKPEPPQGE